MMGQKGSRTVVALFLRGTSTVGFARSEFVLHSSLQRGRAWWVGRAFRGSGFRVKLCKLLA